VLAGDFSKHSTVNEGRSTQQPGNYGWEKTKGAFFCLNVFRQNPEKKDMQEEDPKKRRVMGPIKGKRRSDTCGGPKKGLDPETLRVGKGAPLRRKKY